MKKTKLIVSLSGILCAMALAGCNANVTVSEPVSGEPVAINIEVSETAGAATATQTVNTITAQQNTSANTVETQQNVTTNTVNNQQTVNTATTQQNEVTTVTTGQITTETEYVVSSEELCAETESTAETNTTQNSQGKCTVNYTYVIDETNYNEYAIVRGDYENGTYWEYETCPCEIAQYCRQEKIASPAGMICVNEGGYILALNEANGDVLWRNEEYVGGSTLSAVDANGRIFVASYDGQALVVIDSNGETVISVEQFADYIMPSNMYINGNNLVITYDCADNAAVEMNITDFSYTIK